MSTHKQNEKLHFQVIMNYEGRYFIWPIGKTLPGSWRVEGKTGTRKECLRYLLELWSAHKPLSFQQIIAEQRMTGIL